MRADRWLVIPLVIAAAACQPTPNVPAKPDPHAQAQSEMEAAGGSFEKVVVVRLQLDGQRMEVSSILPLLLVDANLQGQSAKTIFRINDRADGLVLFSRDIPNAKSYRTELPLTQLSAKKEFSFPVVQADGKLKDTTFVVVEIVTR